jgi:diguanylate cyclase (GGDEF)-like protein
MNRVPSPIENEQSDFGAAEIRANLQKLERRDLWVWGNAVVIILALSFAVFSLSSFLTGRKTLFGLDENFAVRVLIALVIIFTGLIIFQHLSFRRLQRELAEQQIQAEVFRRLAMFDPLTGLYNRRFAEQRLKAEIARSERKGHALIVVLIDLNGFKQINDTYGHQTGDTVLKEFAKRLNRATRGSDLAARWGGDEFMMLLVDCEPTQLHNILDRLEGFSIDAHGRELPIAHAVGWKSFEPGDQMSELIEAADRMLYANKSTSKKQEPAPPPHPELASRLL